MFCQVMDATNPWYAIASSKPAVKVVDDSDKTSNVPFQSSEVHEIYISIYFTIILSYLNKDLSTFYNNN